jgi:hypothetical protein
VIADEARSLRAQTESEAARALPSAERARRNRRIGRERDGHDLHLRVDERVFENPTVVLFPKPESGRSVGRGGVHTIPPKE